MDALYLFIWFDFDFVTLQQDIAITDKLYQNNARFNFYQDLEYLRIWVRDPLLFITGVGTEERMVE